MKNQPLLPNPLNKENTLSLIPGKFYRFSLPPRLTASHYITQQLWKEPSEYNKDWVSKGFPGMALLPMDALFMFVGAEPPVRYHDFNMAWCKVIYKDVIGFIWISTYNLHKRMELVTGEE